jgi:hypothetical protein
MSNGGTPSRQPGNGDEVRQLDDEHGQREGMAPVAVVNGHLLPSDAGCPEESG